MSDTIIKRQGNENEMKLIKTDNVLIKSFISSKESSELQTMKRFAEKLVKREREEWWYKQSGPMSKNRISSF